LVCSLAELAALGVAFVSLRDNLDLTTPAGRLTAQLLGAMAEFERSLTLERVRAGLAHARSTGVRLGRPRVRVNGMGVRRTAASGQICAQIPAAL
jgi:DNA invertase Pin-like site-specific DNA recombinase